MLDLDLGLCLPAIQINVALQVSDEIFVLFGPSGAGKTLTIKMIAGLARPDRGRVVINGRVAFDASDGIDLPPQQRNTGYVPQRSGVFPHLTVLENVALPLQRGAPRARQRDAEGRALTLLERFGLGTMANAYPAQMSGGELQRVALARVMALQPDILLVDEPFAALDGPVRAELRREFRAFQRELGIPAIFITHDIEEAAVVGDRIAIMVAGEIRQIGKTREILDAPADREVATLVQTGNMFEGIAIEDRGRMVVKTEVGIIRPSRCTAKPGKPVTVVIRPEGIRILREDRGTERFHNATILPGVIREVADRGASTSVAVAVGEGYITVTLSPTASANLELARGKAIRLAVPPERVHLISE